MSAKRAILFVNGDLRKQETILSLIEPDDLLIAVDGGLRHLELLNLQPRLVVGDLDSITPQQLQDLRSDGVEIIRFPEKKDETDLELALDVVLKKGLKVIWVVGALGGRLDQTLGNIFLMGQPALQGCDIRLEDGVEEVFLVRSDLLVNGSPGDVVSLIPIVEEVSGVSTTGLEYPLKDATLFMHKTRGISNLMLEDTARIQVKDGALLCIHTRKENAD